MQYQLVVSDMDGTLLRHDKTVSERTVQAIRRYVEAGGRFTVATGRGVESVSPYVKALGLRTPLLLLNGCLVYDPVQDSDLFCCYLTREAMEQVWPILLDCGLELIVHGPRRAMVLRMNEVVEEHLRLDGIRAEVRPDMAPANAGTVVKILTIGDPVNLDRAEAAIRQQGTDVKLVRSHPTYLEVLPPAGGKGLALQALLRHLGLPRSRALAIGDYLNDLELFQKAGLGVAVANAHPEVKRAADRWTASNEEDGVAQVLEALVEGRPVGTAPAEVF
ncbi:MAG TPA: HAD family hydrolase [Symbiobacteriaceae bacterium]